MPWVSISRQALAATAERKRRATVLNGHLRLLLLTRSPCCRRPPGLHLPCAAGRAGRRATLCTPPAAGAPLAQPAGGLEGAPAGGGAQGTTLAVPGLLPAAPAEQSSGISVLPHSLPTCLQATRRLQVGVAVPTYRVSIAALSAIFESCACSDADVDVRQACRCCAEQGMSVWAGRERTPPLAAGPC